MIDRDGLYERGILSAGIGWQVPRIPGLGEVDWGVLFSALYRAGYDGDIIIEHEDRVFEGTDEKVKRGLPDRPRRPAAVHQVSRSPERSSAGSLLTADDRSACDMSMRGGCTASYRLCAAHVTVSDRIAYVTSVVRRCRRHTRRRA